MKNFKIAEKLTRANQFVGKHSPLILTALGVVGLGATSVLAYKASRKVEVIVEEVEAAREANVEPDRFEVGRDLVSAMALPIITGTLSIAAITLSYYIQNNRIQTLGMALATAGAERAFFHNKYKEQYGEEEYRKFTTPVMTETHTAEDGTETKEEVRKDVPSIHGEWFDRSTEYSSDDHNYNLAYIKSVENNLQLRMFRKGFLQMNEVFEALGFERTRAGALLGWSTGGGFDLSPETMHCMNKVTGEVEPQIYVKWTEPKYIYESVEFSSSRGVL